MDLLSLVSSYVKDQEKAEKLMLNAALDEDFEINRDKSVKFNLEYQIFICQRRQAQLQSEVQELREQINSMKGN